MLVGFVPLEAAAQAPQTQTISPNSPLIPDVDGTAGPDLGVGDSFRLLFLTSTRRNGAQFTIVFYNQHVQNAANDGHADISRFSSQFRALVSAMLPTNNDVRDFTATNGTGIPIYWLLGAKVAGNYDNFYDGSWDSRVATNEDGTEVTNPSFVWTGSNEDGTRAIDNTMGADNPRVGRLDMMNQEIDTQTNQRRTAQHPLYAISPVINIAAAPNSSLSGLALSGNPPSFPAFNSATTDYDASVPNDVTSITLMSTPNNTNATVTIGATYPDATTLSNVSGASIVIPLDEGLTVITIVVTATASDSVAYSTTYTVRVTRLPPPPPPPLERHLFAGSPLAPPGLTIGSNSACCLSVVPAISQTPISAITTIA